MRIVLERTWIVGSRATHAVIKWISDGTLGSHETTGSRVGSGRARACKMSVVTLVAVPVALTSSLRLARCAR